MRPIWHIISSFILGIIIFHFSKSFAAGLLALLSGVFIDLDHLVDFWVSAPKNPFSIKQFYHMDKYLESKGDYYTFIFLHSWELMIVLTIIAVTYSNIYLTALTLSILLHFLLDTFNLEKTDHPLMYSFIFRAIKRFQLN